MGEPLPGQKTVRGTNVSGSLYKNGQIQSVILAEEIDVTFESDDLATDPLSSSFTVHEQYPNSVMVAVKGIKKGNQFLKLYATEFLAAAKGGRSMEKYSFVVKFYDPNAKTTLKLTIVEGALKADTFTSGPRTGKSSEGFSLQGNLEAVA